METTHKYFISEYIVTVNINMRHLNKWIFECFPIEIAYHIFFWGEGGVRAGMRSLKKSYVLYKYMYTQIHYNTLQVFLLNLFF